MQSTHQVERSYYDRTPREQKEYEETVANRNPYERVVHYVCNYIQDHVSEDKKNYVLMGKVFLLHPDIGMTTTSKVILVSSLITSLFICVFFYPQSVSQFASRLSHWLSDGMPSTNQTSLKIN